MFGGGALYDLQFKIIPKICSLYEDAIDIFENFKDTKVINKKFMQRYFEKDELDWDDFIFTKRELPTGVIEYIYDFGEPPRIPLCRFAIFYVDKAQKIFEYITLEKTFMFSKYPYLICGQKGEQHKNYSTECPADLKTFEEMVKEIIDKRIVPINGAKVI